jgi:hypothetical protein
MLPTDQRILGLSPFQQIWIYSHIKRLRKVEAEERMSALRLICTFINPKAAKEVFGEREIVESSGFFEDLKSMDPNFNPDEYDEILRDMEQ